MLSLNPCGIEFVEIISSQIRIRRFRLQDMVNDDQDAMRNGHDRLLLAQATSQAMILRREVVVFGMGDRPDHFSKDSSQIGIAFGCSPSQTFSSTLSVAWTETRPRG